jgi:hypothetical protein
LGPNLATSYLFDPVKMPGGFQGLLDAGLRQVLQGSSYKFIHDCRMDVAALFLAASKEELQCKNVSDTQIMFGIVESG